MPADRRRSGTLGSPAVRLILQRANLSSVVVLRNIRGSPDIDLAWGEAVGVRFTSTARGESGRFAEKHGRTKRT